MGQNANRTIILYEGHRAVACACLVSQSCPTLCDPVDCSPPGSSVHGDSPGKNIGVGCHYLLQSIFPTQGLNLGLVHCRRILYQLSHQECCYLHLSVIPSCHGHQKILPLPWGNSRKTNCFPMEFLILLQFLFSQKLNVSSLKILPSSTALRDALTFIFIGLKILLHSF